ncbi:MAG: hypothetical protein A3F11_05435 [Gammaproteobacteria bacterium RIFCSPHIGHO2_12_FULL_37_14]|nr:MAG: hypothetical protein A3F11_05435 [Gammaproteobacteria bacterium RIFCSPHIGHO2_12_FULL_37_14]
MKKIFPFIILFALLTLLGRELLYANPNKFTTSLAGETVPNFQLNNILSEHQFFNHKDLIGQISLLNVWATWCYACKIEMPMLMEIKEKFHIPIFGIAYKDDPYDVKMWLQKFGDPYRLIGDDKNGNVAIDLGIYGTPETFVINAEGKIIYRHIGVLDRKTWETVLYPLIKKL